MPHSRHAVLEVDLNAICENIAVFKQNLKKDTKLIAMVKADAYGLGAVEVSKQLIQHQCVDYLAVAYTEEALKLREAQITLPIMVMNTNPSSYDALIALQAEPSIFNFRTLNAFTQRLIHNEIQRAYPVHLKLNTGMNRLGFGQEDIHALIEELADNPYIRIASIFSHFAVSDDPNENDFTRQQFERFNEFYERISLNLGYQPLRHISNSAAISLFPTYQMDMVRLGIGMYGIDANIENRKNLKNVVILKSFISQIRKIKKGETVSYGRVFKAEREHTIGVVSIGYADGVHRCLSNGRGKVAINGKLSPIIGIICMDMLMVDLTDIDCKEGDEVILFGENPTIYEVAKQAKTIPYEIITSVAPRVQRIYY